jgi:LmbE family N-acetylglucosaminyl deacetylase
MKVLVVAPHPDDECIGCGGAVCRHGQRGDEAHAVFLTSGELGLKGHSAEEAWKIREKEARQAARVLKLASVHFLRCPDWTMGNDLLAVSTRLVPILQKLTPDMIYLPHPEEWHPDHKATLPALCDALNQSGIPRPQLRAYEVWTPLGEYQHVENITEVMPAKLRALRKHHSQVSQWDYVRAVRGLNEFRGAMAGRCRYAEVFQEISYS